MDQHRESSVGSWANTGSGNPAFKPALLLCQQSWTWEGSLYLWQGAWTQAASRFWVAVSWSLYVLCGTSSLYLGSRGFYFQLCRDGGAEPTDLALGNCTAVVNPLPNSARKECLKGMQLEIVAFLLALELLWGPFPHLMLPYSCMPGIRAVYLPNSWLTHIQDNKFNYNPLCSDWPVMTRAHQERLQR